MELFKKIIIILCFSLFGLSGTIVAQKFGYIDSKFILNKMPDYKQASAEIQQQASRWQTEIDDMRQEVDKLRREYLAEEVLLTDDMKKERQDLIAKKDKEAKEKQNKVFGFEGLYFLKKQELVKPLQDKIFDAVEKVCKKKKIAIMFDKAGDLVMIYTNPVHDYTDFVLEELGLGEGEEGKDGKDAKSGGAAKSTGSSGGTKK